MYSRYKSLDTTTQSYQRIFIVVQSLQAGLEKNRCLQKQSSMLGMMLKAKMYRLSISVSKDFAQKEYLRGYIQQRHKHHEILDIIQRIC